MFSRYFIDRPILASVPSIIITLAGLAAVFSLPVAQYPEITPPTVRVSCTYPGASAQVVADTVAAPIEQQVNGVEGMLYMSSNCNNDGTYQLNVTFKVGTDLNMAQVLVQNKVALALPTLPDVVKQIGVTTMKRSPDLMLMVSLISPSGRYDQLYLSNYALIQVRDELARLEGVGDAMIFGQRDYSLRVWLDPYRLAARGMTAGDVVQALREQNVQVAAGQIGQQPAARDVDFQFTLTTLGRLTEPEQFAQIIVKTGDHGQLTRLGDVARVDLGAKNQDVNNYLDDTPMGNVGIFQLPGSNALATAERVKAKMAELAKRFPQGVEYRIRYDTTPYISESIHEVFKTLRDAVILVALVVLAFLQNWRSALIPLIAVPVAIIGTFAAMALLGFSLNTFSLFGLVLAIGIVVDDAIVVVEATEHHIEQGMAPRAAAHQAMSEVSAPVIAIGLVLASVFIPCVFITGISGLLFRQFALTIAVSTILSAFNSLTLSPALCAILLKERHAHRDPLSWLLNFFFGWFFKLFNKVFDLSTAGYLWGVGKLLRVSLLVLVAYGGLLYLTGWSFNRMPTGFIPNQDQGYMYVTVQLPDSSSLERTDAAMARVDRIVRSTEGVAHVIRICGMSFLLGANGSHLGTMFVVLEPFEERQTPDLSADAIMATLRKRLYEEVEEAKVGVFAAPPVRGLGSTGGFKIMVEDRGNEGPAALQEQVDNLVRQGNQQPGLVGLLSIFSANTPQLYVDIDRTKCKTLGVALSDVFDSLQIDLGGLYVNDFNQFGRTYQVNCQADVPFRMQPEDLRRLHVRNRRGKMVPLGTVATLEDRGGPFVINRYNMYPAAAINGAAIPGMSSGEVIAAVERLAAGQLSSSMAFEWTELMYLQLIAGNTTVFVFGGAVMLVFLVLAGQYESWSLPLAVILVVPMCILCSVAGVALARMDINVFTQIGFVVLVGLASKNAILIVEFAKAKRESGMPRREATLAACRLRLRPIMMTSFAFILGVVPLVVSSGAGAEMRRTLGTAVFSGMLGVTFFGIFLTPVFYYVIQWFADRRLQRQAALDATGTRRLLLAISFVVMLQTPGVANELADPGLEKVAAERLTAWTPDGREIASSQGRGETIAWDWQGSAELPPAALRLTGEAGDGGRLDLTVPVAAARRPANPVNDGYVVWWENSMRKVLPTESPPSGKRAEAAVSLARNESEGLQVALTVADRATLRDVKVNVGPLTNERGETFPPEAVTAHLVGYVYVETPSGHPAAPTVGYWCPEVLLPLRPFEVVGGRTQTVWVDFHAGPTVVPGTYRGRVVVAPANAPAAELPVSVRVRRFTLPQTPRMKTAFAMMDGFTRAAYGQITPALRRQCLDLMLSHRLNPDDISRTEPPAIDDLLYARDRGLTAFNILNLVPKPKGNPLWTCLAELKDYPADFNEDLARRLDGYLQELRKHGLSKLGYFYGFDEREAEYDELIRGICKFLKKRYPEVSTFTTAGYMYRKRRNAPPDDQDYMDWYCPLTSVYDPALSARLRQQGKQVWWYVCCGPQHPYANFASMDYPSIEGRLLGWMTYGFQADGLLFWHVNLWHPNGIITRSDPYLDWKSPCVAGMTGDGCLTYPTSAGPVSSIRLENVRDGLEDYDYLALLADALGRPAAMKYVDRLVKSMTDFCRDPAALAAVRDEIADQIEARNGNTDRR